MKKYVPKNSTIEAVQYTGINRREIMGALGITDVNHCQRWSQDGTLYSYILVENQVFIGRVDAGQWIVKESANKYTTMSDEDFRLKYEEWPT